MADPQTDTLLDLIRCERVAAQIYAEAVSALDDRPPAGRLRAIRDHHETAATALRRHLDALGGSADKTGPRAALTEMLTHATRLLGGRASLAALRHEEEHLVRTYQAALLYGDLPPDARDLVQFDYLPAAESNARILDSLSAGGG